jgi:hypothetical protein
MILPTIAHPAQKLIGRCKKEALMYTVDYGYFNYPMQTKRFATYEAAKKFFYFIRKDNRVKRVELTCP